MLYLDTPLPIVSINPQAAYHKYGVIAGCGQCRSLFTVPIPPEYGEHSKRLEAGFHLGLTLGRTNSNKGPRIISALDDRLYLVLSSRLSEHDQYVGNIRVPRHQEVNIINRAKAFPDSGKWETLFIRAKVGEFYYVNWNSPNGSEGVNSFYYVAALDQVYTCPQLGIPGLCDMLGIRPPFTVRDDPDPRVSRLDYHEWRKL